LIAEVVQTQKLKIATTMTSSVADPIANVLQRSFHNGGPYPGGKLQHNGSAPDGLIRGGSAR
jgi:hypothetical protein